MARVALRSKLRIAFIPVYLAYLERARGAALSSEKTVYESAVEKRAVDFKFDQPKFRRFCIGG
jgi:hypothetical protein